MKHLQNVLLPTLTKTPTPEIVPIVQLVEFEALKFKVSHLEAENVALKTK